MMGPLTGGSGVYNHLSFGLGLPSSAGGGVQIQGSHGPATAGTSTIGNNNNMPKVAETTPSVSANGESKDQNEGKNGNQYVNAGTGLRAGVSYNPMVRGFHGYHTPAGLGMMAVPYGAYSARPGITGPRGPTWQTYHYR